MVASVGNQHPKDYVVQFESLIIEGAIGTDESAMGFILNISIYTSGNLDKNGTYLLQTHRLHFRLRRIHRKWLWHNDPGEQSYLGIHSHYTSTNVVTRPFLNYYAYNLELAIQLYKTCMPKNLILICGMR